MSSATATLPATASPTYGKLLRLDEVLEAACVHDDDMDRILFLSTHQSCEIFFAVLLRHLEEVRAALDADDAAMAVRRAAPLPAIMSTLTKHFDGLATMADDGFNAIREEVGEASGFQSVQFREIEFLCGLRDTRYLTTPGFTERDRARLTKRLEERSVQDAYRGYVDRCADREAGGRVREALLAFDEAVTVWRARHAVLAERFIGNSAGTAGSAGAAYLWRAALRRVLPDVWKPLT
ncbi:tryptophan 2,3-dioxygenase family protein [Streptomyces sp. NPDC006645]|uniref:tryptophan 2,3-dioxygenase family protein n=1 Tax=unclassified Streptomyces TaxID=2593676 RepID=UPI0033B26EB2